MRILSLDYDPVYGTDASRTQFASDQSVFDYDMVVWDPAESFKFYAHLREGMFHGLPSLSDHASVQIMSDTVRRRTEFTEFMTMGRSLVVMASPPQGCYIDTGKREYSGTGRSRKTTRIVDDFDLLAAIPGGEIKLVKAGGKKVTIAGDSPLSRLLTKYKSFIRYTAVISKPSATVIARVTGTSRAVSLVHNVGGGYLIFLPTFDFIASTDHQAGEEEDEDWENGSDGEEWLPEAESFQYDLQVAIEQLTGSEGRSWPTWANSYLTSEQRKTRLEVTKQQKRIEAARAKLAKLQRESEELESQNQLFLGTGRPLEIEVKKVLELLGGTVHDPDPGREDWKVSFPERDVVVEVKGVGKSAAEKQAAQLEKWIAGSLEETGDSLKGLLVVNTWRDLPIDERKMESFPAQMLPYSESRGHCLVTGLQLLIIRNDIERNPERATFWRNEILETAGLLTVTADWRSVIEKMEPEVSGEPSTELCRTGTRRAECLTN